MVDVPAEVQTETLKPEDFMVFSHYEKGASWYITGPKIIKDFGMEPEKTLITVDEDGSLHIVPDPPIQGIGGFHCAPEFWRRVPNNNKM